MEKGRRLFKRITVSYLVTDAELSQAPSGKQRLLCLRSFMRKVKEADYCQAQDLPLQQIIIALRRFRRVWVESWMEICQGRIPPAEPIDQARTRLVEALADHSIGNEVPLLQRHLRIYAVEFIVALQAPTISASAMKQMRPRYMHGYDDALIQAEAAIARTDERQGVLWKSKFWRDGA